MLIAYPDESRWRIEEFLAEALKELTGSVPSVVEQQRMLARNVARQIVAGSLSPAVGAERIYWNYALPGPPHVRVPELDEFGLLSSLHEASEEWGDPDHALRASIEADIIEEAKKLLSRAE